MSAMTCPGNGTATSRTKSHSPCSITESRICVTRNRIWSSCLFTILGVKALVISARYLVCRGGSIPVSVLRMASIGSSPSSAFSTNPPRSDEKVSTSRATRIMSRALVMHQNPALSHPLPHPVGAGCQCTGSNSRSRRNSSCGGPSPKRSAVPRLMSSRSGCAPEHVIVFISPSTPFAPVRHRPPGGSRCPAARPDAPWQPARVCTVHPTVSQSSGYRRTRWSSAFSHPRVGAAIR